MDYLKNLKNKLFSGAKAVQSNKPVFYGLVFVVFIIILIALYRKYKQIVNKERMEPVFIRNVKKADQMIQISDDLIPAPIKGVGFTYSVWLYCNNYTKNMNSFKHVFHKGDLNGRTGAPAVWMLPNTNALAIIMDTADRAKDDTNIQEDKDRQPEDYLTLNTKDQKMPNISSCSCKVLLNSDSTMKQAAYIHETKDCILYAAERPLVSAQGSTSWTKINPNIETVDPRINKDILVNDSNTVIVENIPLQRWFHLVIVTSETAMEVYVDGKLYRTIVLKSLPKTNGMPLFVNMNGGFDGMINELRYYPYPLRYIDVYNMYSRGPTPFYFMYLLKGKLELYEEKANKLKTSFNTSLKSFADDLYD